MKKFYKFMFYKLYRYAISNEQSVSINWGFICLAAFFEILHLLIVGLLLKLFYEINFKLDAKLFSILFLILGTLFNYLFFINNQRINRINNYFQEKNYSVWKGNLLFFGYVIILFIIMFIL